MLSQVNNPQETPYKYYLYYKRDKMVTNMNFFPRLQNGSIFINIKYIVSYKMIFCLKQSEKT